MPGEVRRVIVLGSTGSIGVQSLEVIEHLNAEAARASVPRLAVVGLAAGSWSTKLREQAARAGRVEVACAAADAPCSRRGTGAAEQLVRDVECDIVVSAISGSAGLPATLAAVELGRDVALANKETLVAGGGLIVPAARRSGSSLLPVDSEHAALWQCLQALTPGRTLVPPTDPPPGLTRAWITSSGGALRGVPRDEAYHATPEQALRHPTWSMGPKVTIDSATLMNKALELIEAHWLFGLDAGRLGVLIHPQSIVHAVATTIEGGAVAQLAPPDMRGPIQRALTVPRVAPGAGRALDVGGLANLELRDPAEHEAVPVALGLDALGRGGTAGAVLNAANEAAVAAFLVRRIPFGRIVELVESAMDAIESRPVRSLDDVLAAEAEARRWVERAIPR